MGKVIEFRKRNTGKVNGWANWDTWEAYNILTSDIRYYKILLDVAHHESFNSFKNGVHMLVDAFYHNNPVGSRLESNIENIDYSGLVKVLKDSPKLTESRPLDRTQYGPKSKAKNRPRGGGESGSSAVAMGDSNVTR